MLRYLIHQVPVLKHKNCGFTCSSRTAGFITLLAVWIAVITLSPDKLSESEGTRQEDGTECSRTTSGDIWTSDTNAKIRTENTHTKWRSIQKLIPFLKSIPSKTCHTSNKYSHTNVRLCTPYNLIALKSNSIQSSCVFEYYQLKDIQNCKVTLNLDL